MVCMARGNLPVTSELTELEKTLICHIRCVGPEGGHEYRAEGDGSPRKSNASMIITLKNHLNFFIKSHLIDYMSKL